MNHEADSVQQLRLLSARLNGDCHYVVVENQAHREHFRIYEDSKTRARIMGELRGREITMSRLHDWLVTALNENNVTASGAMTHPAFSLIDRQRLKHWQRLFATTSVARMARLTASSKASTCASTRREAGHYPGVCGCHQHSGQRLSVKCSEEGKKAYNPVDQALGLARRDGSKIASTWLHPSSPGAPCEVFLFVLIRK